MKPSLPGVQLGTVLAADATALKTEILRLRAALERIADPFSYVVPRTEAQQALGYLRED